MTKKHIYRNSWDDNDTEQEIDVHDKNTPLVERALFMLTFMGSVCCDDLLCTDEELALAMNEIEKRDIH
tara:strand:+ start:126 stop:332 length:207 start_codon:yes stop_codon:yes gene_type:complete